MTETGYDSSVRVEFSPRITINIMNILGFCMTTAVSIGLVQMMHQGNLDEYPTVRSSTTSNTTSLAYKRPVGQCLLSAEPYSREITDCDCQGMYLSYVITDSLLGYKLTGVMCVPFCPFGNCPAPSTGKVSCTRTAESLQVCELYCNSTKDCPAGVGSYCEKIGYPGVCTYEP